MDITTSSKEALPALSPRPLIVHSTCLAPFRTAAREFETSKPLASLETAMLAARRKNKSYEAFALGLDLILEEMRPNVEGKTMGTLPAIVLDFKKIVLDIALDIWTDPTAA